MIYRGRKIRLDKEGLKLLRKFPWGYDSRGYLRYNKWINGKCKTIFLHRLLLGDPPFMVDHINRKPLDNRRCNLRAATHKLNGINRGTKSTNKSGSIGVYQNKHWPTYIVKIAGKYYGSFPKNKAVALAKRLRQQLIKGEENGSSTGMAGRTCSRSNS